VIRDNPTPDNALRFNTLFTRLLTQHVLQKKWGVLRFLLELVGSQVEPARPSGAAVTYPSPVAAVDDGEVGDGEVFLKAFSYQGLHRLPVRNAAERSNGDVGLAGAPAASGSGLRTKSDILVERGDPLGLFWIPHGVEG
jgi:hypothetical protein